MKHASLPSIWRPIERFRWWHRRRPVSLSVWWLANEDRWAAMRLTLLAERGLTEEDVSDVRVP